MNKLEYKNIIRKTIYGIFSVINRVVPKKKQIFVYGGDILNNNSEAMVRFLNNKEYDVICMADLHMDYGTSSNIKFIRNNYMNAINGLLRSKVVIDSFPHTIKMRPTSSQLYIHCCHGSPMKRLYKPSNVIRNIDYYSLVFYAAEIFKDPLLKLFGENENKMYLNGMPHSDYLLEKSELPKEFKKAKKNIVWMPTYRQGLGAKLTDKCIPIVNESNIDCLNNILIRNDAILYIKAHILQQNGLKEIMNGKDYSNIILLSEEDFVKYNIPVYSFIGCMDALITDYSGVYFDFLLTDKPIGFAIDDLEEYNESCGTIFDNPLEFMAGSKIKTLDGLSDFIEDICKGKDEYKIERQKMRELTCAFTDGKNRERCFKLIKNHFTR